MKKISSLFFLLLISLSLSASNNLIWKPAGGSTSANTAGNWRISTCTGTVATTAPGSTDTITFTNCSSGACHIDANMTVATINMKSTYSGTVSIDQGKTLTFQTGIFKGGTFTANDGAITCTNNISIDGTSFTSTSGNLTVIGNFNFKSGSFSNNSGKVTFKKGTQNTPTISSTANSVTVTFYKVEFAAPDSNTSFDVKNITMQVDNQLKLSGSHNLFINTSTSSAINAKGDILSVNSASVGGGDVQIVVNGTGSQNINDNNGTDPNGKLPNVKINKSSGTCTLQGDIGIGGSANFEYAAGTLSAGTSKLMLFYNNTIKNSSGGAMSLYDLQIIGNGGTHTVDGTITVTHTFSTSQTGNCVINAASGGGVLNLQGSIAWQNTATSSFGNVTFKFSGSNSQNFSGNIEPTFYNLEINKSGGSLTLQKALSVSNNLNLVVKNLITDTTNILTLKNGSTVSNASASSFVSGPMKKIGNSAFTFPVGKGTAYKPINITAPSSSTDAFRSEYFNAQQSHGSSKDSLTYLSACEYWNLKRTAGSSGVKVTLYWDNSTCAIYALQTLKIGRWDGSKWNNTGACTTSGNTTSGSIQTNTSQGSFGDFIIAKRSPAVFAHAGSDVTICNGTSHSIGGSPSATGGVTPFTYSWSPSTSLSSSTVAAPTASPTESKSYILTVTDLDLTIAKDTINVNVHIIPVVDAGPDYTVCTGIGVILGGTPVASEGTPPYTIQWKNSSGSVVSTNENPSILSLSSFYSVVVTDSNSCIGKDTMHITLTVPPQAHAGRDTTVCYGSVITLGAAPSATGGESPYTYKWFPAYYLSSFTAANPVATSLYTASYVLHVEDNSSCPGIDDTIYVGVKPRPTFNTGGSQYVCTAGDTVTLGGTPLIAGGYPPYAFYWYPNYFIDDTFAEHPRAYPPNNTTYFLVVTDSFGCVYYVHDSVRTSTPKANAGFDRTIMLGSSIILGGGPTAFKGISPYTYKWNSSLVHDSTVANPVVAPSISSHYSLKITDNIGCLGYDTVSISVTPHASSSNLAILLNAPNTVMQSYILVTVDSAVWFKFHSDSTHAFFACGWVRGDSSFTFSDLTLYSDSALSGLALGTAYLTKVNPYQDRGIVTDRLQIGNDYYLRLRKTGSSNEATYIVYSAVRPGPQAAELLQDY